MISTHRSVTINECCTPCLQGYPTPYDSSTYTFQHKICIYDVYLSLIMIKIGSNAYHHSVMYINPFFNRYYPIR